MGLLAKVLKGVGSYLVEQGKYQDELNLEEAKAQILYNRELALKQVDAQIDEAKSAGDHADRLDEIHTTGEENRLTAVTQGIVTGRNQAADDARQMQREMTLKTIDFSNNVKLEKLRTSLGMSKSAFDSQLQQAREAAQADGQVDRVVFSTDGQMQLVYKNGDIVSKGPKGAFNPSGSTDDGSGSDLGGYLNSGGTSSGAAISRTAPQRAPAAPAQAPAAPTQNYKPGDTIRNPKTGQALQLGPDGKWKPYLGIAP